MYVNEFLKYLSRVRDKNGVINYNNSLEEAIKLEKFINLMKIISFSFLISFLSIL